MVIVVALAFVIHPVVGLIAAAAWIFSIVQKERADARESKERDKLFQEQLEQRRQEDQRAARRLRDELEERTDTGDLLGKALLAQLLLGRAFFRDSLSHNQDECRDVNVAAFSEHLDSNRGKRLLEEAADEGFYDALVVFSEVQRIENASEDTLAELDFRVREARDRRLTDKLQETFDDLPYTTERGERVRSQAEVTIANLLHGAGIRYDYEKPFHGTTRWQGVEYKRGQRQTVQRSKSSVRYPDFTIPVPGQDPVIWEHQGMLDDPMYKSGAQGKEEWYRQNGLTSAGRLIVTRSEAEIPQAFENLKKRIAGVTTNAPEPLHAQNARPPTQGPARTDNVSRLIADADSTNRDESARAAAQSEPLALGMLFFFDNGTVRADFNRADRSMSVYGTYTKDTDVEIDSPNFRLTLDPDPLDRSGPLRLYGTLTVKSNPEPVAIVAERKTSLDGTSGMAIFRRTGVPSQSQ